MSTAFSPPSPSADAGIRQGALTLPEECLLLRRAAESRWEEIGLPGASREVAVACFAQLALRDRIVLEHGPRTRVLVADPTPTGDPELDRVLRGLARRRRPLGLAPAVENVASWCEAQYTRRLVARELLSAEVTPRRFGPRRITHHADHTASRDLDERIFAALSTPESKDLHEIALAAILAHSGSLVLVLHRIRPTQDPGLRTRSAWLWDCRAARRRATFILDAYPLIAAEPVDGLCATIGQIATLVASSDR
jgi:Golgi phosphoprotein 3 GPP34